jgi:predicted ATPase
MNFVKRQESTLHFNHLKLKNWRNFRAADVSLGLRSYVIGANAVGKSNLLDVFRFLRTLAQSEGGGLQKALKERGGLTKLRSLHARQDPEVRIEVGLSDDSQAGGKKEWSYALAFKPEGKGAQRILITEECVTCNGKNLLNRPGENDRSDPERLLQTHLEQINNNADFRELAEHFSSTDYLHLVPQLLKHSVEIGTRVLENDPFGQGLMQRIAKTPGKTRNARIRRITKSLEQAIPLFSELRFEQDKVTGLWHLEANFKHCRGNGAWQREDQFSDGTLRLIGLLWALQENEGLLLLEEPELSLNDEIVKHIPLMIDRVLRERKKRLSDRQVLISTHSGSLLTQLTGTDGLLLIEPGNEGSDVRGPNEEESREMKYLNPAEVLLPKTRPQALDRIGL